ncbi:hypothetical protein DFJ73DRAFT_802297 [Zopfochytrium polystomum]|nr:hypothetical protein DFJ73DRAFT_802297 [Zopfochytrium polystomum]
MRLYDGGAPLSLETTIKDEFAQREVPLKKVVAECLKHLKEGGNLELDARSLFLPAETFAKLFAGLVNTTVQHLKQLTQNLPRAARVVVLVGNFANSPVLQAAVRSAFEPATHLVVHSDPGVCVVKGSVLLAAGGAAEAPAKCSSHGAGGGSAERVYEVNGQKLVRNALDMFVELGDVIEMGSYTTDLKAAKVGTLRIIDDVLTP